MAVPAIHIAPIEVFQLGPISVTNSMLAVLVLDVILILFFWWASRGFGMVPSRIQVMIEVIVNFFMESMTTAFGNERQAKKFLPLFVCLFFFILLCNQFGLLPLLSQFVFGPEASPLLRTPTADYSMTIALAIGMVIITHIIALMAFPLKHIGNYIKIGPLLKARKPMEFGMAFVDIFLGFLDIIGEIAKVISLSSRLFGNILAGEVIVLIISTIAVFSAYIIPVPFIFLGAFSSITQAFVLPFLTMQYLAAAVGTGPELEEAKAS